MPCLPNCWFSCQGVMCRFYYSMFETLRTSNFYVQNLNLRMSQESSLFLILKNILNLFPSLCCSDLGVHVDGFIANVAHTFVIEASKVSDLHAALRNHKESKWIC